MDMQQTTMNVAEYCEQLIRKDINVNRDYQRSPKVWPPSARSFLIDTILKGYPMPKVTLHQKVDLQSRSTIKDIVDGQQRSVAILDFYQGKLRLSGESDYAGATYSELEEPEQQAFLAYALSVDLLFGVSEPEIREVFRRINSYSVPLNRAETLYATYQGAVKWFLFNESRTYSQSLKDIGVFSERQLTRMNDFYFFAELAYAYERGIETSAIVNLRKFFAEGELEYSRSTHTSNAIELGISRILDWEPLHNGNLVKPFSLYSLLLALEHLRSPIPQMIGLFDPTGVVIASDDQALLKLSELATVVDEYVPAPDKRDFVNAMAASTNTKRNRGIRFISMCNALSSPLTP